MHIEAAKVRTGEADGSHRLEKCKRAFFSCRHRGMARESVCGNEGSQEVMVSFCLFADIIWLEHVLRTRGSVSLLSFRQGRDRPISVHLLRQRCLCRCCCRISYLQ